MIGQVEFTEAGRIFQATLGDDGRWICDGSPQVAELLNRDCAPVGDPTEEIWGYAALIKAARRFHGLAWSTNPDP
jgi:hypothetical protein